MKNSDSWAWAPHVLAIELKKALSYRLDFWVTFILSTTLEISVAYFLWKSVFEARQVTEMEGFTFLGIVYYYLFANFSIRIARGSERGYIAQEIYDGGLTRYLLYPLSFMGYKYMTHLSQQLLSTLQFVLALIFLYFALGLPTDQKISAISLLAGVVTCLFAGVLHFAMASCLEMVAFWQDVIWNLMVMLRFVIMLLGGGMIPLDFFPDWGRQIAMMTPFPILVNFPVKTFLGQITLDEWLHNFALIILWTFVFSSLASWIWSRGTKKYSGVGI